MSYWPTRTIPNPTTGDRKKSRRWSTTGTEPRHLLARIPAKLAPTWLGGWVSGIALSHKRRSEESQFCLAPKFIWGLLLKNKKTKLNQRTNQVSLHWASPAPPVPWDSEALSHWGEIVQRYLSGVIPFHTYVLWLLSCGLPLMPCGLRLMASYVLWLLSFFPF